MKTKTFGIVIVIAVVAIAAVLVVTSRTSSGSASASGYEGQVIAPGDFDVADYAGKPLVVNMFGSWCPPCNAEAPDLGTFAKDNPGAQVVGIACEDTQKAAEDFMTQYGLTYPLVVDDGTLVSEFGITAYPTTIFYDATGKEVDRLVGASTLDQFNASLAKAQ
jgi:cytochrome c biogenesis protein CcmG, thiol:disulfide interchange protein DsbE